jgi:hypothetical protein
VLVVLRDGKDLSLKASFVVQLFALSRSSRIIYITRNRKNQFKEQWAFNKVELATASRGILWYFLLMILKSPRGLHDGIIRRLFHRGKTETLVNEGFFSIISDVLYHYFANSSRSSRILSALKEDNLQKIFLVDEFLSINTVKLKKIRQLGPIIYLSQDLAHQRYGYYDNLIAKNLMYRFEKDAIAITDLVIACSERDRIKYIEMGAREAVFYPNIYPIAEFEPGDKDMTPSISIVLREHWGMTASRALEEIFDALSQIQMKLKVYMIGIAPKQISRNIELEYCEFISNKVDYLQILSKSWVGTNIGMHLAGSNERKYDYAMANLVVFSDKLGARGDFLPHEYTYVDSNDLTAKLQQLLQLRKEKIFEMGMENRAVAKSLASIQCEKVLTKINNILSKISF